MPFIDAGKTQVIDCVRQKIHEKQLQKDIATANKQMTMVRLFRDVLMMLNLCCFDVESWKQLTHFAEANDKEQKFEGHFCNRRILRTVQPYLLIELLNVQNYGKKTLELCVQFSEIESIESIQ